MRNNHIKSESVFDCCWFFCFFSSIVYFWSVGRAFIKMCTSFEFCLFYFNFCTFFCFMTRFEHYGFFSPVLPHFPMFLSQSTLHIGVAVCRVQHIQITALKKCAKFRFGLQNCCQITSVFDAISNPTQQQQLNVRHIN